MQAFSKLPIVTVVSATREKDFASTPLGISLNRLSRDPRLIVRAVTENAAGLPLVYNRELARAPDDGIIAFVHDDLWIEDYFFVDRLVEGFKAFDVLGLAGNITRHKRQVVWSRKPGVDKLDLPNLRGAMAHGNAPLGTIGFFGPIVGEVELLDGVFMAAKVASLRRGRVAFDERFDFHLYDLDFSRTAKAAGLRLGTFPLATTHRSTGAFGGTAWERSASIYLAKWGE